MLTKKHGIVYCRHFSPFKFSKNNIRVWSCPLLHACELCILIWLFTSSVCWENVRQNTCIVFRKKITFSKCNQETKYKFYKLSTLKASLKFL